MAGLHDGGMGEVRAGLKPAPTCQVSPTLRRPRKLRVQPSDRFPSPWATAPCPPLSPWDRLLACRWPPVGLKPGLPG